jgi:hypothetical protein
MPTCNDSDFHGIDVIKCIYFELTIIRKMMICRNYFVQVKLFVFDQNRCSLYSKIKKKYAIIKGSMSSYISRRFCWNVNIVLCNVYTTHTKLSANTLKPNMFLNLNVTLWIVVEIANHFHETFYFSFLYCIVGSIYQFETLKYFKHITQLTFNRSMSDKL